MKASIVSIGDELILGQTVDSNAAWLSGRLAGIGIEVCEHVTVGDDQKTIVKNLQRCSQGVDVLMVTGGLGPTEDDLTRRCVAAVLGVPLVLDEKSLEEIEVFFERLEYPMPVTNHCQAMIPEGAEAIFNSVGTAPGIACKLNEAQAFFLPGVPREMKAMYEETVEPLLRGSSSGRVVFTRILHSFGMGESTLGGKLEDLMTRGRNPRVNTTAAHSMVSVRIVGQAESQTRAREMIEPIEAEIRDRLGDFIFGADRDTLADAVGGLLKEKKKTLAIAESCTGGLLGKLITDVAGASGYFKGGWIVYSNEAKIHFLGVESKTIEQFGAVSEQVAGQLAAGAHREAKADYGIGITGIAGPGGGSKEKPVGLVYIGLADGQGVDVKRVMAIGNRQDVRRRAAYSGLDLLRKKLLV